MEKTHWKKVFNSNYLGSSDLTSETGYQEFILTIKEVKVEVTKGTKEKAKKNICYFKEAVKPMILNATHCKVIKKFADSNFIEDWGNTLIQVYVEKNVAAFGETVDALRIRPVQPKVQQEVDVTEVLLLLDQCETEEDLKTYFLSLPKEIQTNAHVKQTTEQCKLKFA